jgi:hypothetical protein
MSGLTELLARVEAAAGPSVEIDGLFAKLNETMPQDARFQTENIWGQQGDQWLSGGYGDYHFYSPEEVTASIDAALALVERMLPLRDLDYIRNSGRHRFSLALPGSGTFDVQATGATAPLAILAALLRALIARTPATRGKP